jgi:hypothetical protein
MLSACKQLAIRSFSASFTLRPGENCMTAAQVRADEQTIAAYIVTARRMANAPRTHCRGDATGTIEWRSGNGTERHDAGFAPCVEWKRRIT